MLGGKPTGPARLLLFHDWWLSIPFLCIAIWSYDGSAYWLFCQVSNSIAKDGLIPWYPNPPPLEPKDVLIGCKTNAIPSAPPLLHPKNRSMLKWKGLFKFICILFQTDPDWFPIAGVSWKTFPGCIVAFPFKIKFGVITGRGFTISVVVFPLEFEYVPALVCQLP